MNRSNKSIVETHPQLAKEWDYDKNTDILPDNYSQGSGKKVFLKCEKGHSWQASISNRTKGGKCPICQNRIVLKGFNDLTTTHPELAKEWDYDKNGDIKPYEVSYGQGKKVWWKCNNGHSWNAQILSRSSGRGCPFCSGKAVKKGFNDLASKCSYLLNEWDYEKNIIDPHSVNYQSAEKVWWKCEKGHSWKANINTRTKSDKPTGCPYCKGIKVIEGVNDILTTYPRIAKEWDYEKNGELKPSQVMSGSNRKVWWICPNGHSYLCGVIYRTKRGEKCPYCSGKKVLEGYNDLTVTNRDICEEWDYEKNEGLTPVMFSKGSGKSVWWICSNNHSYYMRISHRTSNHGCPYCAGEKPIEGINDLATTHPELVKEWNYVKNGETKPSQFMRYSSKKVWWIDTYGHEWKTGIDVRTMGSGNCPICNPSGTSFPEQAILFYLSKKIENVKSRYNELGFEIDIFLPSLNVGIEYDGLEFHKNRLKQENEKDEKCYQNNIHLIRVRERGLKKTSKAVNIFRLDNKDSSLEDVIKQIFNEIDVIEPCEINIARDYGEIRNKYILLNKEKSLGGQYLQLVDEWDSDNNHNLSPFDVAPFSNRKVWWKCQKGHSWEARICDRTKKAQGCPYCNKRHIVIGINDLATTHPELVKEWDYERNGTKSPDKYGYGSGEKVWWKCQKGHSWEATINSRVRAKNKLCPICSKRVVIPGETDLSTTHPEIVKEWDFEKNNSIVITSISDKSEHIVFWKCEKGHSYRASISSRIKGVGCPFCFSRTLLSGFNDLATLYPSILKEWDYEKNNVLPTSVLPKSYLKVWWKCQKGHSWEATIYSRVIKKTGCPFCLGRHFISGAKDLATLYPHLTKEWDYHLNEKKPEETSYGTNKTAHWICELGHKWEESVNNRVRRNTKCPYCFPRRTLLQGVNDLETLEPLIAKEWDYEKNGELKPSQVMRGSNKKAWWICKKGHSYYSSINMRSSQGLGCPYCSGQKVLIGYNDLVTTNPDIAKQWDYDKNGDLTPSNVSKGSNRKVWWICSNGHSFEARIQQRTTSQKCNCPFCNTKK